ncbi:MAG: elongation factor P maturation arginine rhamnosyltransferase EarP [Burkholderiales bacterium]|nr:MAG: elongation factor P maturation arginine rhamnosyltransferase EarP [Burkholderiales bacterium]
MTERTARLHRSRWDIFCRVVDNFGDAGFCWRLARQLALEHDQQVRLWIDDPAALAALRPGAAAGASCEGVRIEAWRDDDPRLATVCVDEVADVVVGALACSVPDGYRRAMARRRPVWIDLEYLSAEAWVHTHHGLPSPKPDGLVEHFFFPGFDDATGGLLREADLLARHDAFDADARRAFLASIGAAVRPDARLASLFCYPDAPAVALLDAFAARDEGWRVLVPAGVAPSVAGHPVAVPVPFVPQADFDRLLWSCSLNFVRGEESFVRGLWAQRPMVWQAYRQAEGVHMPKVRAFVERWVEAAEPGPAAAAALARMETAWNADPADVPQALDGLIPALPALRDASARWARANAARPDLAARLAEFVAGKLY